jgi:hypothetical protein
MILEKLEKARIFLKKAWHVCEIIFFIFIAYGVLSAAIIYSRGGVIVDGREVMTVQGSWRDVAFVLFIAVFAYALDSATRGANKAMCAAFLARDKADGAFARFGKFLAGKINRKPAKRKRRSAPAGSRGKPPQKAKKSK